MYRSIEEIPSRNHSSRKGTQVDTLVLHHTGGTTLEGAVQWMRDPASQVSAHYVVGPTGRVVRMVPESEKAWHAGPAHWQGERQNIGARSIGVEIVNPGDGRTPFPGLQLAALALLIADIRARYPIPWDRIVGHREIAWPPGRKTDPADNFPWPLLWTLFDRPTAEEGGDGP